MKIFSYKDGGVIFESPVQSINRTLQQAIQKKIEFHYADFRKQNFTDVNFDGFQASQTCFWSATFTQTDMAEAVFENCDFRLSLFKNTCLSGSAFKQCDFRGASFSHALLDEAVFVKCHFSCASFLKQDFSGQTRIIDCTFSHLGEREVLFSNPPIYLQGLGQLLILLDEHVIIGADLYEISAMPDAFKPLVDGVLQYRKLNLSSACMS